jgi:hypothetical protein
VRNVCAKLSACFPHRSRNSIRSCGKAKDLIQMRR